MNPMKHLFMIAVASLLASPVYAQLEPSNSVGVTYGHVHLNVSDMELHKRLWVDHFGVCWLRRGRSQRFGYPECWWR